MSSKRLLRRLFLGTRADRIARRLTASEVLILMLHRVENGQIEGPTPEALREGLEWMRGDGAYAFVPLEDLFSPEPLRVPAGHKVIAVTIDDGYRDQVEIIGEQLNAFDIPSTLFVTTGFVDRAMWMWWDRVRFLLTHTERRSLPELASDLQVIEWGDAPTDAIPTSDRIIEAMKRMPEHRLSEAMELLGHACEVTAPVDAPEEFAPATWDQLRRWASTGLGRLAPHTITHPILSQLDAPACHREIVGSWERLLEEVPDALPIFAYPNGTARDFGPRERDIVAAAGLTGSVSTVPQAVSRAALPDAAREPLPRLAFPYQTDDLRMLVSGVTSLAGRLRGA